MASGDSLLGIEATAFKQPPWTFIAFTSGGTSEVSVGDTLTGATSGATADVVVVTLTSGSWAGGDAAGFLVLRNQSGTFQSENLDEGANSNVCTIGSDTSEAFATADERGDNGIPVFDFDAAGNEYLLAVLLVPRNYGGGGVTVQITWGATSATTAEVVWVAAFLSISDDADDLDAKAFATAQSVTATTASASGEQDYADIAFSAAQADNIAAGEWCLFYLGRNANDGADDMAGDAELLGVEIRET